MYFNRLLKDIFLFAGAIHHLCDVPPAFLKQYFASSEKKIASKDWNHFYLKKQCQFPEGVQGKKHSKQNAILQFSVEMYCFVH